ncbi:Predicted thiol-disulfide oxidoreductase YuxK, DCC family [Nonlabens sp. Hel1_33_55]|uniref:thiol-disulfide oxidoreductase DCC family protein n=1 Tax=Nonlabens sp. Hel1_33_55 TaxID=1336802 RepID=UPI000875C6FB|nr:thiol-disulfide oxidoreductase DCC family protein [Nonlabens sp. Hel1_33_55]SCY03183.1 Predicted thiol-disulfide oxidoreductase YuxK, DCC family [Nonlabens sp. Hel1_33_55]
MEKKIVLFDGVCNLCNKAVTFIIEHDPKDEFRFAALQSDIGEELLAKHNIDRSKIDSIILIKENKAYIKASAALRIAKDLKGPISLVYIFVILPKFITNTVYDFIARNRYDWFGKKDNCMIPTTDLKSKFLDQH